MPHLILKLFFTLALSISLSTSSWAQNNCPWDEKNHDIPPLIYPICSGGNNTLLDKNWDLEPDDTLIWFLGGDKLYFFPGRGLVRLVPSKQQKEARKILGISAHGASGTAVIKTGKGTAFLYDSGRGLKYNPWAVYKHQVESLVAGMGVSKITHLHISHAHLDHLNTFKKMVLKYNIPAKNIIIPGFMMPFAQELLKQWQELAKDPRGIVLGYKEHQPGKRFYRKAPGGLYYEASFQHGDILVEYIATRESRIKLAIELKKFRRTRKKNAKLIDTAEPLVRLSQLGTPVRMVILGDLRGADILKLKEAMERTEAGSFSKFFRGVEIVKGMQHHLGAINGPKDVEGIKALLKVTAMEHGRLEVLVQTGIGDNGCKTSQGNIKLIEALKLLGVRMSVTIDATKHPSADASKSKTNASTDASTDPSTVTTDGTTVRTTGPRVIQVGPVKSIQNLVLQIAKLRQTMRTLYENYNYMRGLYGESVVKSLGERLERINKEINTLYDNRVKMTLGKVKGKKDFNISEINTNTQELQNAIKPVVESSIKELDQIPKKGRGPKTRTVYKELNRLGGMRRLKAEIEVEIQTAVRSGQASKRLWNMLVKMYPEARNIRTPLTGKRLVRNKFAKQQAKNISPLIAAAAGGKWGAGQKGSAAILVLYEFLNMGADVFTIHQQNKRDDVARGFGNLVWLMQRGLIPFFKGVVDSWTGEDIKTESIKTILKWIKERKLNAVTYDIPHELANERWLPFILWAESNVRNFDEYSLHFKDYGDSPIDNLGNSFPSKKWQIRRWFWEDPAGGSPSKDWVKNDVLNKVMHALSTRVVAGTKEALEVTWSRREKPNTKTGGSNFPSISTPPDERLTRSEDLYMEGTRPTRRAYFAANATQQLYSNHNKSKVIIKPEDWWEKDPYLFVFENISAPTGYVVVGGANYNTYGAIRSAKIYGYDPERSVEIPKSMADMHHTGMPGVTRNERHKKALEDVKNSNDVIFVSRGNGSGVVQYWGWVPNRFGLALAKVSDLKIDKWVPVKISGNKSNASVAKVTKLPKFKPPKSETCNVHRHFAGPKTPCGSINCDCNNVKMGILVREYKKQCRAVENELKLVCEELGQIQGSCDPVAHGPRAYPK